MGSDFEYSIFLKETPHWNRPVVSCAEKSVENNVPFEKLSEVGGIFKRKLMRTMSKSGILMLIALHPNKAELI